MSKGIHLLSSPWTMQRLKDWQASKFIIHFLPLPVGTIVNSIKEESNQGKHSTPICGGKEKGKKERSLWSNTLDVNLRTRVE